MLFCLATDNMVCAVAISEHSQHSELASVLSTTVSKKDSEPLSWYHVRKNESLLNFYGFMHGKYILLISLETDSSM